MNKTINTKKEELKHWDIKQFKKTIGLCPECKAIVRKRKDPYHAMILCEHCDAVSLVPRWRNSKGTQKEIKRAEELNIPVLYNLEELVNFMLEHKLPDE